MNKPIKDKQIRKGIYLLYKDDKLQYIGKSIDINNRIYAHKNNSHLCLEGKIQSKNYRNK